MFRISEQPPIIAENDNLLIADAPSMNVKNIGKSPAKPKGPRPGISCTSTMNGVTITLNKGKKLYLRNLMSRPAHTHSSMLNRDKKRNVVLKVSNMDTDKMKKNNKVQKKQQG